MKSPLHRVIPMAFAAAWLGCSSNHGAPDASDVAAVPDAPAADGGGVCCPLTAAAGCSPSGDFGGWAASASACRTQTAFDGCPFVASVDDHGCAVLTTPACSTPCGSVARDAAADAADAATNDPRCGATFDSTVCGAGCATPGLACQYPGTGAMSCAAPADGGASVWQCVVF